MERAKRYRAWQIVEEADGTFSRTFVEKDISSLPVGEVLIRVAWSSLNYKDALSATGNRGVTRKYPHTPGIDASGWVVESTDPAFTGGDEVIVTSYDLGMNTPGGFAEYIRVPAAWVVPLPPGLTLREAMLYGTAGLTAGMAVEVLRRQVPTERGEVLVTGATGGVGCLAVALLAAGGYRVAAVTGKPQAKQFLTSLGAMRILSRDEAVAGNEKPLLKGIWAGVVDTVGGDILAAAIKATDLGGVVTCCGNVASPELAINVFPFILRGVSLVGIDSQNCPMERRRKVWSHLAGDWKPTVLEALSREIVLEELDGEIGRILKGEQQGRVLIRVAR